MKLQPETIAKLNWGESPGGRLDIRQGEPLPKKFANASWGDAEPNGLRAAWVLEPGAAERRIGATIKARLLATLAPVRLGPGEYIEINTPGIGFADTKPSNVMLADDRYAKSEVPLGSRLGDEKRFSTNTLELGLVDKPLTINLTVHDAPATAAPKTEKSK